MNSILNIVIRFIPIFKKALGYDTFKKTSPNPSQGGEPATFRAHSLKLTKSILPLLGRGLGGGPFCLLLTANCLLATAQSFPVQVVAQAVPPAPIYFSSYSDAGTVNGPLRVQLVLNDLGISDREIRLKAYFEGNGISFQSNDVVSGAGPLFLEGGIPLVLGNTELAPYFRFGNLTGISPAVYGQAIPEGTYKICFEVYDVLTGNRLSRRSCATTVVFQNEPPFLVSPANRSILEVANPQNIVFQWTPRSINVTNVEYELSLVEIWDNMVDPQQAFLSSNPVFQTTTNATAYLYGPADPLLLPGKNYAWRVRAMAKRGTDEIGLFKNQGNSEIYSFGHAGACDLPTGLAHEVKGGTNANIRWDDLSTEVPEYTVRYRKKSPSASAPPSDQGAWFTGRTTANQLTLWDLRAGTTYEYQLRKKCAVTESGWSSPKEFTTLIADDASSVYECGISPDISLSNKEPLPSITSGEAFTAGDFHISIREVSGGGGRFTGNGYVTIPYLNNIKVAVGFTNVLINTDRQLAEGTVVTKYDPDMGNIVDVDEAIETVDTVTDLVYEPFEGNNDLDEMRVNFDIPKDSVEDYIKIKDGKVTITNPVNGANIAEPLGDDKIVVDSSGQAYHIDAVGKITEGGQIDRGGAVTSSKVAGVSTNGQLESLTAKDILITFKEVPREYGFDEIPNGVKDDPNVRKEYTAIKDADGNDYILVHQAVGNGQVSYIDAIIEQSGNDPYPLDSIVFKSKQGEKIPVDLIDDDTVRLTLKGSYTFENETIYAVVHSRDSSRKQLTAGAFSLWHMTDRAVNVVLVSVNGATIPNDIETDIRQIFKKGVVTINITKKTLGGKLNFAPLLGDNRLLDIGESPWLTNYNEEQKAVISYLKPKINYDQNTYYLLVFGSDVKPSKSIGGFMPLQRQFGFIFNGGVTANEEGKGDLARTIAHEIGHGVFALRHPFDQYEKDIEGKTDWLMDYANGSLLSHMDWAQLHNPDLKFYVFQDEEEGEIAGKTWLDPAWKPFKVDSDISRTIIAFDLGDNFNGAIPGFKTMDGHEFKAKFTNGSFDGYFDADQNKYSPEYPKLKIGDNVFLFEYRGCGDNRRYEFEYNPENKSLAAYKTVQPSAPVKRYEDECNTTTTSNPFNASICSYFKQTDNLSESTIEAAVEKLNLAYQTRKSLSKEHFRNKEDFYHLVNLGQADFNGRAGVLEDKLFLLKQTTGINFDVIFQPIAARLSPKARDDLAIEVLKRSDLPYTEDNVVITLPYMTTYNGVVSVINCVQPGFAQSAASILLSDRRDFRQADNLFEYVLGAFAGLEKPLFIRRYFLKANGSLVNQEIETKNEKRNTI